MKLKDLIESGVIRDADVVTASKPLQGCGADFRKGKWYQDQILDFMDLEIKSFSWDETNGFSIALKG